MDLLAYAISQDETVSDYVVKNYGEPRFRGVRFMKTEAPQKFEPYSWRDESDAGLWARAMHPTRDWTYRDHYFHAVKGEDYDKIIAMLEKPNED